MRAIWRVVSHWKSLYADRKFRLTGALLRLNHPRRLGTGAPSMVEGLFMAWLCVSGFRSCTFRREGGSMAYREC